MSIAIYSRKSKYTGKGESIENQIIKCKKFIEFKFEHNDNIEIFVDEGFSGKNENRPEYQKMINKVKSGEINSIVIYQLNRLGRNARDIHNTMQMCCDLNAVIYSATEGFDSSTSFGRAVIGILASLAQLEREQLAERVKDNMYTLAKMGRWLGGQSPLGFEGARTFYIDESGKQRSITELKVNTEEQKIVKAIFNKYLEERSLSQVGKWSLTNNFKGKNKGDINKAAINVILQNPVYVKSTKEIFDYFSNLGYSVCGTPNGNGLLRYGNGENIIAVGKHKGIIEANDWLKVQHILRENTIKAPSIGKSSSALLTGLLKCKCGAHMQVRYGKSRKDGTRLHYYVCNMKVNSAGSRCNCSNINGLLLEEKLIKYIKNYNKEKLITELNNSINFSNELMIQFNVDNISSQIESNKKSIKQLLDKLKLVDDEEISKILLTEIKKLKDDNKELEEKKNDIINKQCEVALSILEQENIIKDLEDFNKNVDSLSFECKKKYLNELLDSIVYDYKSGKIEISFKIKKN